MLINSRPPLNELILSGIPMSEETFLECLSYTPALTKLTAWGIRFSDTTLGFLTIKDATIKTSAALCPRLKFLDLGLNSHFSPSAMKELIISRSQDSVQVAETVTTRELLRTVYCSSFMMESVLSDPAIAKCVNEGLECLQLECE
ncbi:hypothetical protein BD410DRAFT_545130 [Rickenella mellea]|uniref:RNI-like protein n=1 Tax=Rickenella mellea TaxID=50990 RepID=A0A4Y7PR54_9AGAM|nr:hypothetical protein BD410DRAFT_545130 [Rickenella mellea]